MARNKLSNARIQTQNKAGIYSDGDGLYLRVRRAISVDIKPSKQWFFIFRRGTERTEIGLGGYGQGTAPVSLALAREKAEAIRQQLARGEDPRPGKSVKATFKDIVDDVLAVKEAEFRNAKHRAQWRMTLDKYAADLHDLPVADITVDDVVKTLKQIWDKIPETADRLRLRIGTVLDHAKARGLYQGDNPAVTAKMLLPARQKLTRGHHAAVDVKHIPAVIAGVRKSDAVSARAVEFTCLTAARSGEARFATWSEINFEEQIWIVPAERMKASREHRVPLTARAFEILMMQKQIATGDLIFGGESDGRPISDVAMTKSLRRASGDLSTLHGLRSSFRDYCGDITQHPREVIEAALAHSLKDKTEAAYRRSDALEKRRQLMDDWATYCASGQ